MIASIWEKFMNLMANILMGIEMITKPVLHNDTFVMILVILAFALLIVGPVLAFATANARERTLNDTFDSLENSGGLYGILAKLFYYPVVFAMAFLYVLSGNGGNTGMFQGMVDSAAKTGLSNFLEWTDTCKYFFTFLFLYVVLKTIASILKLRLFRLLRFYIYTINFVTIGFLSANLYMVLVDASRGNILMTLVALAVGFCFYSIFIFVFIGMVMPLVLIALPLVAPFIGPLRVAFGLAPLVMPAEYNSEAEVIGHMMFVNAWLDLFSA